MSPGLLDRMVLTCGASRPFTDSFFLSLDLEFDRLLLKLLLSPDWDLGDLGDGDVVLGDLFLVLDFGPLVFSLSW